MPAGEVLESICRRVEDIFPTGACACGRPAWLLPFLWAVLMPPGMCRLRCRRVVVTACGGCGGGGPCEGSLQKGGMEWCFVCGQQQQQQQQLGQLDARVGVSCSRFACVAVAVTLLFFG